MHKSIFKKLHLICMPRLVLAAAVATISGEGFAADQKTGEIFARDNCSRCDSITKTGHSPYAKAPTFRFIAHQYKPEYLQEALAEGIVTGHNIMPEFVLSTRQIDDLIAYIQTLK